MRRVGNSAPLQSNGEAVLLMCKIFTPLFLGVVIGVLVCYNFLIKTERSVGTGIYKK